MCVCVCVCERERERERRREKRERERERETRCLPWTRSPEDLHISHKYTQATPQATRRV